MPGIRNTLPILVREGILTKTFLPDGVRTFTLAPFYSWSSLSHTVQ